MPRGWSAQPAVVSGRYSESHMHTPVAVLHAPWPPQPAGHVRSSQAGPAALAPVQLHRPVALSQEPAALQGAVWSWK